MGKKKLPENMAQVASNSLEELANFTETNESAAESEQQAYQPTNNNGIADKYLSNNGFDPSKATTGGSGATITAGKADSFIERMREAFDRNEKIMYPHSHRHRQQLPQAYQDKVATLKDLMNKQMRDSLDFLDTGLATDSRQDILTEQAAMKLVSRFPNKGGILSKDSVILNNAPVARMIAGFQNLVIEQMFEDTELAVMLCRQVGTMEAAGFGKEGFTNFGRAYAYRLGYADNGASKPTGPNRRNFNSPRGVSVIGEIRLTNEWKQIVLDTDFAAAFRWAMLDFWFLSQQSVTGYDILAQAWLRLRERLLRSMNQYLLRNFYNQISEAGAIARIETVASVAPGASNGHYHIGEYVAITNQTNVTIGGVVVPVANTNIGAIVRVRGGNTSGEAFLNVPIVEPRNAQEIDQNGVFIDNPLNELKVQIGESQDGFLLPGILHNGNICKYNSDDELVTVGSNEKYYATNSGNGLVFISSGANPPATPAGSGANRVIVHYSQETNFSYFNQDITGKKTR